MLFRSRPPRRLQKKYARVIVETADEQILRGVVVDDVPDALTMKEDPLSTCNPTFMDQDNLKAISHSRLPRLPDPCPRCQTSLFIRSSRKSRNLTSTICSPPGSQEATRNTHCFKIPNKRFGSRIKDLRWDESRFGSRYNPGQ